MPSRCYKTKDGVQVVFYIGPNGERDGAENHEGCHCFTLGAINERGHPKRFRKICEDWYDR